MNDTEKRIQELEEKVAALEASLKEEQAFTSTIKDECVRLFRSYFSQCDSVAGRVTRLEHLHKKEIESLLAQFEEERKALFGDSKDEK